MLQLSHQKQTTIYKTAYGTLSFVSTPLSPQPVTHPCPHNLSHTSVPTTCYTPLSPQHVTHPCPCNLSHTPVPTTCHTPYPHNLSHPCPHNISHTPLSPTTCHTPLSLQPVTHPWLHIWDRCPDCRAHPAGLHSAKKQLWPQVTTLKDRLQVTKHDLQKTTIYLNNKYRCRKLEPWNA